jgi:hypothetical protein
MTYIEKRIEYWIEKRPSNEKLFELKHLKGLITIAVIVAKIKLVKRDVCEDFVDGMLFSAWSVFYNDIELGDLGDEMVRPMNEIIISHLGSHQFKLDLISTRVFGNEILPITIPEITITPKVIYLFTKDKSDFILSSNDVDKVRIEYIKDTYKRYGVENGRSNVVADGELLLYPMVFDRLGFKLFHNCIDQIDPENKSASADIAYFFHRMKAEGFLHAKEEVFKQWFLTRPIYENFNIGRIHNFERYTQNSKNTGPNRELSRREDIFSKSMNSIKSH